MTLLIADDALSWSILPLQTIGCRPGGDLSPPTGAELPGHDLARGSAGEFCPAAIRLDAQWPRGGRPGDLGQLIWKIDETISYLSSLFELAPGDLILTGTPAGVAAVQRGDRLHGHVDGVGDLKIEVTG